jgi:hypothetical protein
MFFFFMLSRRSYRQATGLGLFTNLSSDHLDKIIVSKGHVLEPKSMHLNPDYSLLGDSLVQTSLSPKVENYVVLTELLVLQCFHFHRG